MRSLPLFARAFESCSKNETPERKEKKYKYGMLILTFFSYMSYHLSRKPLSIVKGELHHNCTKSPSHPNSTTWCDFAPFDQQDYKSLFGELDYAFLFSYAIGMFISGMVAERVPLRYFLSSGMILSGIFTAMFGLGFFANIHVFYYYIIAQVLNGFAQTTGWPGVVTCVGNWFGKSKRGLIMGVWNSHTSIGNILGSVIASLFVTSEWGLSFVIPGCIIAVMGVIVFLALVESPADLGINTTSTSVVNCNYQPLPNEEVDGDELKNQPLLQHNENDEKAISFYQAATIPGVIEFSLCLFFAKLVSYTFLFWLPLFIQAQGSLNTADSGLLSTLFDIGGIVGGIAAGVISDKMGGRSFTCGVMLIIGAVMMALYNTYASTSMTLNIVLLIITGAFVNGPYALITTAVSADLGTHEVLQGNSKALSTVTAIIDGTGSIGAAIGPLLTGIISSSSGWKNVFIMLIASNIVAVLCLIRLMVKEARLLRHNNSIFCRCCSPYDDSNRFERLSDPEVV